MKRLSQNRVGFQTLIVFVFLFLNSLFTVAAFHPASSLCFNPGNHSGIPNPGNNNDPEENIRLHEVSIHRFEQRGSKHTVKEKLSSAWEKYPVLPVKEFISTSLQQDAFWRRPVYYHFLSLFHLF